MRSKPWMFERPGAPGARLASPFDLSRWLTRTICSRSLRPAGKEMLQNLFVLRFRKPACFSSMWNRDKRGFPCRLRSRKTLGHRGGVGYFDSFGIIRDMIATHLSQILAFVAMEKPAHAASGTTSGNEKLKLLRLRRGGKRRKNCVLGGSTPRRETNRATWMTRPCPLDPRRRPSASVVLNIKQ